MIEEMKIRRYTPHTEKECRNVAKRIIELQQENQILKEQLKEMQMNKTNYTEVNILTMLNHKYKSVLDEIREFIKKCSFSIEGITNEYHDIVYAEDIEQILDKVGKE